MDCLELGRTPIHEALHPLATETLVIIAPRRDTFVGDFTVADLPKIFELHIILEGYCAQRATEAHIAPMGETVNRLEQAARAGTRELMRQGIKAAL